MPARAAVESLSHLFDRGDFILAERNGEPPLRQLNGQRRGDWKTIFGHIHDEQVAGFDVGGCACPDVGQDFYGAASYLVEQSQEIRVGPMRKGLQHTVERAVVLIDDPVARISGSSG